MEREDKSLVEVILSAGLPLIYIYMNLAQTIITSVLTRYLILMFVWRGGSPVRPRPLCLSLTCLEVDFAAVLFLGGTAA